MAKIANQQITCYKLIKTQRQISGHRAIRGKQRKRRESDGSRENINENSRKGEQKIEIIRQKCTRNKQNQENRDKKLIIQEIKKNVDAGKQKTDAVDTIGETKWRKQSDRRNRKSHKRIKRQQNIENRRTRR